MVKALDVVKRLGGDVVASRLERRVRALPSADLVLWCESAVVGLGRAFGDWQKTGDPKGLWEAQVGSASVSVVLDELERRRESGLL